MNSPIIDKVRNATRRLPRDGVSVEMAEAVAEEARTWIRGLPSRKGFEDETSELVEAMEDLSDAIEQAKILSGDKRLRLLTVKNRRGDKPSVYVVRVEQVWINELRTGLARVRDCYALLLRGVEITRGSRKYIMRQAQWALMCDALGNLPEIERVTGLKKRRLLYKMRRGKRCNRAARAYLKLLRRNGPIKRPLGVVAVLTNYVTGERKDIWI